MKIALACALLLGSGLFAPATAQPATAEAATQAPARWYITGITTEPRLLRVLCRDCLPITISERYEPDLGLIVFYDSAKVPALLKAMNVTKPEELVGKQLTVDDEKDPALAPIVSEGRSCSESNRKNPGGVPYC